MSLYKWYQSNNNVVISIDLPDNTTRSDIVSDLSADNVTVSVGVVGCVTHIEGTLFAPVKGTKVVLKENIALIYMEKAQQANKWPMLLADATHHQRARVVYDYAGQGDEGELAPLWVNELVLIIEKDESGWWEGSKLEQTGVFPSNFVEAYDADYQPPEDVDLSQELAKSEESQTMNSMARIGGINIMGAELKNKLNLRKTAALSKDEVKEANNGPAQSPAPAPATSSSASSSDSESNTPAPAPTPIAVQSPDKEVSKPVVKKPPPVARTYSTTSTDSTSSSSSSSTPAPAPVPVPAPQVQAPAPTPAAASAPAPAPAPTPAQPAASNPPPQQSKPQPPPPQQQQQQHQETSEKGSSGGGLKSLFKKPLKIISAIHGMDSSEKSSHHQKDNKIRAIVLFDFETEEAGELGLTAGETITILAKDNTGWWQGVNAQGKQGWFSHTFVEEIKEAPQTSSKDKEKDKPQQPPRNFQQNSTPAPTSAPAAAPTSAPRPASPTTDADAEDEDFNADAILSEIRSPDSQKLEHVKKPVAARGRKPPSRSRASCLLSPEEREEREKMRSQYYSVSPLSSSGNFNEMLGEASDESTESSEAPAAAPQPRVPTGVSPFNPAAAIAKEIKEKSSSGGPAMANKSDRDKIRAQFFSLAPAKRAAEAPAPPVTSIDNEEGSSAERVKPPPPAPRRANPTPNTAAPAPSSGGAGAAGSPAVISTSGEIGPPPLADISAAEQQQQQPQSQPTQQPQPVVMKPKPPMIKKLVPRPVAAAASGEQASASSPSTPAAAGAQINLPQLDDDGSNKEKAPPRPVIKLVPKPKPVPPPSAAAPQQPAASNTDAPAANNNTTDSVATPSPAPPVAAKPKPVVVRKEAPPPKPAAPAVPAPVPEPASIQTPPAPAVAAAIEQPATTPAPAPAPAAVVAVEPTPSPATPDEQPTPVTIVPSPTKQQRSPQTTSSPASTPAPAQAPASPYDSIFKELAAVTKQVSSISLPKSTFGHQYPELAESFLSVSACSVDGKQWSNDNELAHSVRIPLFQVVWPYIYCILADEIGQDEVDKYIGDQPLESRFDRPFTQQKKVHNAFCQGAALTESHLLSQKYPNASARISHLLARIQKLVKGHVACDMGCYLSQKADASDEVTTAHLLKSAGLLKQPDEIIDIYYQLNAIQLSTSQIATLAVTFAADGISPLTKSCLASKEIVNRILSSLKNNNVDPLTKRLNNGAEQQKYELLSIQSDSGVMILVIPGVMGVAVCTQSAKQNDVADPPVGIFNNDKHNEFAQQLAKAINN
ncbi:hypothetical protein SAMD00019534_040960 [Acytostelium subglobosum LB1]|uniref:hypothetical protein n=1 Tax=Acytostelium subglobosum LB1 TaxID=1410327 RepID=UPI000644C03B|nr:hypothetical protein SAMD00019534_040960 [Acytostelium subglobosum LB1]GAM20921.1 hypothetical protein SAMD00019534_040960 [Acytostelium subglobosum LB1]|eukprot:XP_012756055.1 hypothetical protein SAMD00019534_040960 [Acytostelium subglobosum LB1]